MIPISPVKRPWLIALVVLALAAAVMLVWRAARPPAGRAPDAVERQLDAMAAQDPYLTALKRDFPEDYAVFRQATLADLEAGLPPAELRMRVQARAREQAARTAGHVAAAPAAALVEVVRTEQAVVRRLQGEDQRLCAQFGMTGLAPGTQTSAETAALLSRAAEARVKAARAGRETPVAHRAPDEADLAALRAGMLRAGAAPPLADLILGPNARAAPADQQCAGSVAFYDALAALPPDSAARWMSAVTRQAVGAG